MMEARRCAEQASRRRGGSCADVSAGESWLLIPTCNGGAGTSMVAAGVADEGGVQESSRRRLRDGGGASRWLPALQVGARRDLMEEDGGVATVVDWWWSARRWRQRLPW